MPIRKKGKEIFRPYARLISILGDQLISNKWVAVIELVKNCYDADADNVTVRFLDMDSEGNPNTLEIEDDGLGMSLDIIRNVWMKPATPNKLKIKSSEQRFTPKGRLMQGDKGVGRFAVYKLGDSIDVYTKQIDHDEVKVNLDLSEYSPSDAKDESKRNRPDKFLDQIENSWETHDSPEIILNKKGQGTLIRISDLRNSWKPGDMEKLDKAFYRMVSPSIPGHIKIERDFFVSIEWNGLPYESKILSFDKIIQMAPYSFTGSVDDLNILEFTYTHNNKTSTGVVDLFTDVEHNLSKMRLFRDQFYEKVKLPKKKADYLLRRRPDIGRFEFFFYYFDLSNKKNLDLTSEQEAIVKENSVFLYRDHTRVYPYGESGVDWLMLSRARAEDKAGWYFSYNDLIGFIQINQSTNPLLKDAADREGLMNIDGAYDDFVALIQGALKVMKDRVSLDQAKDKIKNEKPLSSADDKFKSAFEDFQDLASKSDDKELLGKSKLLVDSANKLVQAYKDNLQISQELAGLGMAVEKSSHDTFVLLRELKKNTVQFLAKFKRNDLPYEELEQFLVDLNDSLEFLYNELQIIQPLFRVARKVTKDVSLVDVANRVRRYFAKDLGDDISLTIRGDDFTVKTNTGLILQVFINLMDNSTYWLTQGSAKKREIEIAIDAIDRTVIFADNGPGIPEDAQELVFMEFVSLKAEGRGLGLYIIKELLERIGADITLITNTQEKILPGANFKISFLEETN